MGSEKRKPDGSSRSHHSIAKDMEGLKETLLTDAEELFDEDAVQIDTGPNTAE